jgi:hypothetical protein
MIAQFLRAQVKVPQFNPFRYRGDRCTETRVFRCLQRVVLIDGREDVAHVTACRLVADRQNVDGGLEPSGIVGISPIQSVGNQTEQFHVSCYRDWSSLFVVVVRQPCGPIDERPGAVAIALVESPTGLDQEILGGLLASDAERLQRPAGNRLDVAERSVSSPSKVLFEGTQHVLVHRVKLPTTLAWTVAARPGQRRRSP